MPAGANAVTRVWPRLATHRARRPDDERGAVLVTVAATMAVLLGTGAIVMDVGALYVERRELQNGADAAAIAVAGDCAVGDCDGAGTAFGTADAFADANASDGAADVTICGSGPGLSACSVAPAVPSKARGYVQVSTSTHNPGSPDDSQVEFVLAPLLDATQVGRGMEARAVAAWGPPREILAAPVAFSLCEFQALGGSLDGSTFPALDGYIYIHGVGPDHSCGGGPSGTNLPGGFGWLESTGCAIPVALDTWVTSDPGNDVPCDSTQWRDAELLIPLYDGIQGTGSNGQYHIVGFTSFHVKGYKFGNDSWNLQNCPATPGSSGRCFYGSFTRATSTGDIGDGTDFGMRVIDLVG